MVIKLPKHNKATSNPIDTQRRLLVAGLGWLSISAPLAYLGFGAPKAGANTITLPRLFACAQQAQQHYLVCVDQQGETLFSIPLPARGHGMALHPSLPLGVVFARRPGQFMLAFDPLTGATLSQQQMAPDRHCYGHGCFDAEGLLYVSEGVSQNSAGVIAVYDPTNNFAQRAAFTGFGIGPHEIVLHPDQQHLIVAVGGIQTDGRDDLNIATMAPSLVYLNKRTGALVQTVTLADHLLSIRHLAVDDQGLVALACQYQGDDAINPLLYTHQLGQEQARAVAGSEEDWLRFDDYLGSVAIDQDKIIATSPRGNCFAVWHKSTGALISITPLTDVCGAAALTAQGFVLTTGQGKLASKNSAINTQWSWDNHLMAIAESNL